jgi:hypothetical protein
MGADHVLDLIVGYERVSRFPRKGLDAQIPYTPISPIATRCMAGGMYSSSFVDDTVLCSLVDR